MKRIFVVAGLIGVVSVCSCNRQADERVDRTEAEFGRLTSRLAEQDRLIATLRHEVAARAEDNRSLREQGERLRQLLTALVGELREESDGARLVIDELQEQTQALKRQIEEQHLRRERGEKVSTPMCANGPWERWPAEIREAEATIARNAPLIVELELIIGTLPAASDNQGIDQSGLGRGAGP